MDPLAFEVGPVSQTSALMLAGGTAVYAVLTAVYAWRGHRARLQDRWSATAAAGVVGALAWVLATDGARLVPAPFGVFLVVVYFGTILFTLTYTLGRYRERIERFRQQAGARMHALLQDHLPQQRFEEWRRLQKRFTFTPEERRKVPHLMMGLFLALYAGLGHLILRGAWEGAYGGEPSDAWGEGIRNLYVASHGPWLAGGQVLGVTLLLLLFYAIAPTELLRLRFPELSYPFKTTIESRLRERERGLFGAHYYIVAAAPLAALWIAWHPERWDAAVPAVMAALSVTVFADAVSALVGIRWGRRKWFHHPGKSYLGTLGGSAVALAVSLPLVGIPMAVVTAAVFAVLDILAPVPLPVSDNILNPLGIAAAYVIGQAWLAPMVAYY